MRSVKCVLHTRTFTYKIIGVPKLTLDLVASQILDNKFLKTSLLEYIQRCAYLHCVFLKKTPRCKKKNHESTVNGTTAA